MAFRGTEQDSWRDVITNVSLATMPLPVEEVRDSPRRGSLTDLPSQGSSMVGRALQHVKVAQQHVEVVQKEREVEEESFAAAPSAVSEGDSGEVGGEEGQGVVESVLHSVKSTASDLQTLLGKLKEVVDAADAESRSRRDRGCTAGF